MQLALTLYDVNNLVVDVAVIGGAPGRDHAEELRHVAGSDFVVDEVAELAIAPGGKRGSVRVTDRPPFRAGRRPVVLRSAYSEDDELLRPRIVELEALAGRDVGPRVGLELMSTAVEDERAATGDDEEDLLDSLEPYAASNAPECSESAAARAARSPSCCRSSLSRQPCPQPLCGSRPPPRRPQTHASERPHPLSSAASTGRFSHRAGQKGTRWRAAQPLTERTTLRYSSSRAVWPGGTTSVVIGVQTIAGPGTALPGRSRSKS